MWNPFKKKFKYDYKVNDIKVQDNTLVPQDGVIKCITNDPDVDTAVGYKDLNGKFFDTKKEALVSNKRIESERSIEKIKEVLIKTIGREEDPTSDAWYNNEFLQNSYYCHLLAREIHAKPGLLRDYLNENY